MPRRSTILQLPEEIRLDLDRRLISGGFSNYQGLAEWLNERGFSISKSAIHRYGKEFQEQLDSLKIVTEQAKAITETVGDDENDLADALTRLTQQKIFKALLDLELENDGELTLDKLGRTVATLNRSSVTVKRFRAEVLEKAKATADKVAATLKTKGMSDETAANIRAQILGIAQ
ncbi:MAG: DUF3486 family protein [Kastovskya adunca ATA6-11-RM4]|jgi:intein-encoded DNA endonuclease-like protein|nr:DUF3486 family protein [Kastovskya adunca ATA6-11-RM4]